MFKKIFQMVVLPLLVMMGFMAQAHAAIDTTELVADIAAVGVAILAVIGALLAMSTSIFGLSKVYAFIKRKAGA